MNQARLKMDMLLPSDRVDELLSLLRFFERSDPNEIHMNIAVDTAGDKKLEDCDALMKALDLEPKGVKTESFKPGEPKFLAQGGGELI